jgi:hypothetical protein
MLFLRDSFPHLHIAVNFTVSLPTTEAPSCEDAHAANGKESEYPRGLSFLLFLSLSSLQYLESLLSLPGGPPTQLWQRRHLEERRMGCPECTK